MYGNSQRTNSYEKLGTFWSGLAYVERLSIKDTTGFAVAPLALSENKLVAATNSGSIAFFEHTNLLWEAKLDDSEFVLSNLVADSKENIYFLSNQHKLHSYSATGKKNWTIIITTTSSIFSNLLITNDAIYFSSEDKKLFKVALSGKIEWTLELPLQTTPTFAESEGNLIINITHNDPYSSDSVICIAKTGKIRWARGLEQTRLIKSPVISNGKIYVIGYNLTERTNNGIIVCFDTLGNTIWSKNLPIIPRFVSISQTDEIFLILYNLGIGETLSAIYKLNNKGEIVARQFVSAIFYSPIIISERKIALLGYTKDIPSILFFDKELNLIKTIDLSKTPPLIVQPAVLTDCTIIFATFSRPMVVRIDENPIIKLLPW